MPQLFTNNARALLTASITDTATSMVVESSKADLFPTANTGTGTVPAATDWFKVTLQDSTGAVEIVYVRTRTAGSGIFSNVLRAQEGTTAKAFSTGTVVGLRLTAADIQTSVGLIASNNTFTGTNTFSQAITGDVTGNLTGDVTGDVTGNLTGDVTGDLTGDVTGNLTGDVTGNVAGNLTGNVTGNASGSAGSLATANFSVVQESGKLYFKHGATRIASLDSSGNFVTLTNVTAYDTP
jgi:hypothetical protein